jgi:hypothetical protein
MENQVEVLKLTAAASRAVGSLPSFRVPAATCRAWRKHAPVFAAATGLGVSVLPCGASWIFSGKPCEKQRSYEPQNLPALRQLLISRATRPAVPLFPPRCCLTYPDI